MPACLSFIPTTVRARSSGLAEFSQITFDGLCKTARAKHLQVLGGLHPQEGEDVPEGSKTLLLLGPGEPGFWANVTASPEFLDNQPDPLDRWSCRVISEWASELDAMALFPFGGPPYRPFTRWARETGRSHASPVGLLAHDTAGLMVSFRGALALPDRIDLPTPPPSPCLTCNEKPCLHACPAAVLDAKGYDVSGCHDFLSTNAGGDCMENGCAVRRACPVSEHYGRVAEQSAYHMTLFYTSR